MTGIRDERPLSARLLNDFQRDLPLVERPYSAIAASLDADEAVVIETLRRLCAEGAVARIGPVIRPHTIGASTLAAMRVPQARVGEVAALVSAQPEVNHNYEREHAFNLWFVMTAADASHLAEAVGRLERLTGLEIMTLPMLDDYYIDLGFELEDR